MSGGLFDDLPPPKCSSTEKKNDVTPINGIEEKMDRKRKIDSQQTIVLDNNKDENIVEKYIHAVTAYKGDRDEMQDFHLAIDQCINYPLIENKKLAENFKVVSTYQIFDGHAGRAASKYASENLFVQFYKDFSMKLNLDFAQNVNRKICDSFKVIDENFIKIAKSCIPTKKDGSTALALFIFENQVFVANLGDCRCAVIFKNPTLTHHLNANNTNNTFLFKYLNVEHTPSDLDERSRIEKCGGFVKEGRVMGILEVSRSIGDIPFKMKGVISLPTVTKYTIDHHDLCIIMGCDGFWNSISTDEIIQCLKSHNIDSSNAKLKVISNNLAKIAFENGSNDNITVLVVKPVFVEKDN